MTAPFVIREQSFAEEIAPGVQTLMAALAQRQQLGMERQRLELERQRTQAEVQRSATLDAETRARTKKVMQEIEDRDLALQAMELAAKSFVDAASTPGGLTNETVNSVREQIIKQGDKKIASAALIRFDEFLQQDASRRQEFEKAQLAEAAGPDAARAAQMQDEALAASIERDEAATQSARAGIADNLRSRAQNIWQQSGEGGQPITWGQALAEVGLQPIPGGRPADAIYTPAAAAGGAASEAARKASNFFLQMQSSDNVINEIIDRTGGIGSLAAYVRGLGKGLPEIVLNRFLSEDEQRLVQAQRTFTNAFRYFVSGQQTSDKEFAVILNQVSEQAGDSKEAIAQKRFMRKIMIQAAADAASGRVDPLMAANNAIIQARAADMPKSFIKYLEETRDLGIKFQREMGGVNPLDNINFAPTTPDTLSSSLTNMDSIFKNLFVVEQ